jgi:putative protease
LNLSGILVIKELMNRPELLAPAGDLQKLKYAVAYGADAVYFGAEFGSLRSFAGNFSLNDAAEGISYLHSNGKKGYAALNIYPFSDEYDKLLETAGALDDMDVDAFIVSDLGVIEQLKKLGLKADIHVSTQANTVSYQVVMVYKELGAKRVNLARELSLERIKKIQEKVTGKVETEVFIHGAVCFSYSGRCAISDYMTGYRANRGECKHPCRYKYFLMEETRPGEFMPVEEDDRGQYFFNCKDLALFEFVPALMEAGITSFKIEGRMKSIHYIATVVSFYRQVIDGKEFTKEEGLKILSRVPNRGYSAGFMKGGITVDDYSTGESLSQTSSIFVGNVTGQKINGKRVLEVRNKIHAGQILEALRPDGSMSTITLPEPLVTTQGEEVDFANNSQFILLDRELAEYTIVRRVEVKEK